MEVNVAEWQVSWEKGVKVSLDIYVTNTQRLMVINQKRKHIISISIHLQFYSKTGEQWYRDMPLVFI